MTSLPRDVRASVTGHCVTWLRGVLHRATLFSPDRDFEGDILSQSRKDVGLDAKGDVPCLIWITKASRPSSDHEKVNGTFGILNLLLECIAL